MILGQFAYGKVYLGFGVQGLEIKLQRVGFGVKDPAQARINVGWRAT